MIHTREELELVTRRARRWRDTLRSAPLVKLSPGERAELAHVLDELQHHAAHQTTLPKEGA